MLDMLFMIGQALSLAALGAGAWLSFSYRHRAPDASGEENTSQGRNVARATSPARRFGERQTDYNAGHA